MSFTAEQMRQQVEEMEKGIPYAHKKNKKENIEQEYEDAKNFIKDIAWLRR